MTTLIQYSMADRDDVLVGNMKETVDIFSQNGVDSCDTASQGSKEDIEYDPEFEEQRFRVDRKKLEEMMQRAPKDDESAEDFFQRIMDETKTRIIWPSRLKIGAKSKKDPHVKVIGLPDDVKVAIQKIMSVLDTKSNRVTLKMDVSHTDHSHVIGKGGSNIQRVMKDTACHIHFPDCNRGNNVQEKSNQVSIAGQPCGVEHARMLIRELLPLVFMFELPITTELIQNSLCPVIQHLQKAYSVTISFKTQPRVAVTAVTVRGTVINANAVKVATAKLLEAFTGNANSVVNMHLEIAPQHHRFIIGHQNCNVRRIMQNTNASIIFPDPNATVPHRKGTVVIKGNIDSVFWARENLIGCLPLVLMFDVKEDTELDQEKLTRLTDELDVFISVKPRLRQPSKSVIVKSIERNSQNMYLARHLLLGLQLKGQSDSFLKSATDNSIHCPSGLGLSLGLYNTHTRLLNGNHGNSVMMMNGQHSPPLSSPLPSPTSNVAQWLQGASAAGVYGPLMVMSPTQSHPVQASFGVSQQNGFQNMNTRAFIRVPTPQKQGSSGSSSACTSPTTESRSSSSNSPQSLGDFRHGSSALHSDDSMENVITRDTSTLSSSGHTLDLLGLSKTTPVSQPPPITATLFLDHGLSSTLENGERSSESSGAESDGSEKLVPGMECDGSPSLFTPLPYPFNYEQKKLMALKAMQKNPNGESRIPTDRWSGLGFSKSMPESAIRDRLGQLGISRTRCEGQGSLSPPSELAEGSSQDLQLEDVDRDPWKDSKTSTSPYLNRAPGAHPRKKIDYGSPHHQPVQQQQHSSQSMVPDVHCNEDLAELFSKLGLGKYSDIFQQQEIDLSTFLTLTEEDLKELGIGTFGARRKMMLAIADLNKGQLVLQPAQPHVPNNSFHVNSAMSSSRCPDIASISGRW